MSPNESPPEGTDEQTKIIQIKEVAAALYGTLEPRLCRLLDDLLDLYNGNWPDRQECQVGYHNVRHALDVTLATARMLAGWTKVHRTTIPARYFMVAMAAAAFHDAGYLKDRGDNIGSGGKFTFSHVPRSRDLACRYLAAGDWDAADTQLVGRIIMVTEFSKPPEIDGHFADGPETLVARMVATADLIAQMSDVHYMENIHHLFAEFQEGYAAEGAENLQQRGITLYNSAQEILDSTVSFYHNFVLPRLAQLGGMSRYLIAYFGEGRNPYLESIAANLSGEPGGYRLQWRRIGSVLKELGAVSESDIEQALAQQHRRDQQPHGDLPATLRQRGRQWLDQQLAGDCLGDILMRSAKIDPATLRQGVLAQILPTDFIMRLDSRELLLLLHCMILLQNIRNGRWIFNQLLEIVNDLLRCEACSILLADNEKMIVAHASGPLQNDIIGRSIPIDKGLAGWVFLHNRPSMMQNAAIDDRFDDAMDQDTGYRTTSMLAVPLSRGGTKIGVLEAVNKQQENFSDHDMNLLSLIGNLISNSLTSALWLSLDCVLTSEH